MTRAAECERLARAWIEHVDRLATVPTTIPPRRFCTPKRSNWSTISGSPAWVHRLATVRRQLKTYPLLALMRVDGIALCDGSTL